MPHTSDTHTHHHSGEHHSSHRSGSSKRRKHLISRRKLKKYAPIILAVLLFPTILFAVHRWEEKRGAEEQAATAETVILPDDAAGQKEEVTFFDGNWYTPKKNLQTTLLIGVDKNADMENGQNGEYEFADFLMLLVTDPDTQTYTTIPINRDTMTEIRTLRDDGTPVRTFVGQITYSHTYGARPQVQCRNTVYSASRLLQDITIDHYISLTMDGVAVLNDAVGGVPVLVTEDFSGYEEAFVQGETVLLKGDLALKYVRARRGLTNPTNINRMERQQQYMESLQKQFAKCADADPDFIMDTVVDLSDYLVSDCTANQLSKILDDLNHYTSTGVNQIKGEAMYKDLVEFYPDEQELRELVMNVFYERSEGM